VLFERIEEMQSKVDQNDTGKLDNQFQKIFEKRSNQLDYLINYSKTFLIYGGAGKGIIFSHAFKSNGGGDIFCIDSDPGRQGKFLECSGVEVISPLIALQNFDLNILILVMNKNHSKSVHETFRDHSRIFSLTNFLSSSESDSKILN